MPNLKSDIIEDAYSRIRLSGLTVSPGPRENQLAIRRLEMFAALLLENNIDVDYNFEDDPDTSSESGLSLTVQDAFASNLAMRLCADYGKEPPMILVLNARGGMSFLYTKQTATEQIPYPTRQPVGSGNFPYRQAYFSGSNADEITGGLEMIGALEMVSELEMA